MPQCQSQFAAPAVSGAEGRLPASPRHPAMARASQPQQTLISSTLWPSQRTRVLLKLNTQPFYSTPPHTGISTHFSSEPEESTHSCRFLLERPPPTSPSLTQVLTSPCSGFLTPELMPLLWGKGPCTKARHAAGAADSPLLLPGQGDENTPSAHGQSHRLFLSSAAVSSGEMEDAPLALR